MAGADLLLKMKEILSAGGVQKVKAAAAASERRDKAIAWSTWRDRTAAMLSVDDIVERIMSFDKNKDGKITKDELPERMQYLIEKGDTNKDGALDKEEIKKLAADLATRGDGA